MLDFIQNLYLLSIDASFWLVIGLFIGGIFKMLIPTEFLHRHLSQEGFGSVVKAAILGAPLPLCSCGVIPAAVGLRESGASKSATTSFLVSTPETGVDSVFITYAMMGPFMAISRPIIALVSAVTAGTLVNVFDPDEKDEPIEKHEKSCCPSQLKKKQQEQKTDSCCGSEPKKQQTTIEKILSGVKYAFTDLFNDIVLWLVVGIVFAAVVQTFVPSDLLIKYGTGWTGMLVMLVVGIPMYVCATASTPLAAGFLLAGISPGAVIVFLLAGPATNMATLGIIGQQLGKKTMGLYLFAIMLIALLSGFAVNYLVQIWEIDINQHLSISHGHVPEIIQIASFSLLVFLSFKKVLFKTKQQ